MDTIAVLIPCYNEEQTIEKVITDWKRSLPESVIYVYDNNSTDNTAQIAEKAGAVVRHEYQQGKGNVIRRMFREIDAECYIMVDGDDTYPAEYGRQMVDLVLHKGTDMVVGDRLSSTYFEENKRPFHNFGNSLVRLSINKLFDNNIRDIMTGYRAFSYLFVKTFPVLSKGFEIETEMSIHAVEKNMRIENVVIEYRDRPEGSESKLDTYSDGAKVLGTIFRLFKNYRPMKFFAGLAGIGDLIVTATSMHSRNNRCGHLIGQGIKPEDAVKQVGMVVEGINAIPAALELEAKYGIEMPLVNAIDAVVNHGADPRETVHFLMTRAPRSELEYRSS